MEQTFINFLSNPSISGCSILALLVLIYFGTSEIKAINERLNKIIVDFVDCKTCKLQHDNINTSLADLKQDTKDIKNMLMERK